MRPDSSSVMPFHDQGGEEGERPGGGRSDRIGVGGGDDAVVRIQLAARWAEAFGPEKGDSLTGALRRFRQAFEYLDAVTHGIDPPEPPEARERHRETPGFSPPTTVAEPPTAPAPPAPLQPAGAQRPPVVSSADQPLAPAPDASSSTSR